MPPPRRIPTAAAAAALERVKAVACKSKLHAGLFGLALVLCLFITSCSLLSVGCQPFSSIVAWMYPAPRCTSRSTYTRPLPPRRNTTQALPRCCLPGRNGNICFSHTERPRLVFWQSHLIMRGTTVALFDYGKGWQDLACGEAHFLMPAYLPQSGRAPVMTALDTFVAAFGQDRVRVYKDEAELNSILASLRPIAVYAIVSGAPGLFPDAEQGPPRYSVRGPPIPLLVHGVFETLGQEATGAAAAMAGVSEAVRRSPGVPVVPHIVAPPSPVTPAEVEAFKRTNKIPSTATVICRHGGADTFQIPYAREAVCAIAARHPDLHFTFLGTDPMPCVAAGGPGAVPNIHHLPATTDLHEKAVFLAACDACVHAREDGETFGLAIAECSLAGKPVITEDCVQAGADNHLRLLGQYALLYRHRAELEMVLQAVPRQVEQYRALAPVYQSLYEQFAPERIMVDFLVKFGLMERLMRVE